jgi:hypothetical protein
MYRSLPVVVLLVVSACAEPRDPAVALGYAGQELGPVAICPGSPYATIQAAIDATPSGGVITVCDGTFSEHLTVTGKALTLQSQNGSDLTILDATWSGLGLNVTAGADLTLDGFTIENGSTGVDGGNVYCNASTLNITNSKLLDGAANRGGGFAMVGCTGAVTSSTIDGNHAYYQGGGGYMDGSFAFRDNVLSNNDSDVLAGGLFADTSSGDVTGNDIEYNTSGDDCGGLYEYYGTALVSNNDFLGNISGDDGGGLRLKLSQAVVLDNTFTSNQAGNTGGAAKISHQATTVSGNTLTGNSAAITAGGFFLEESASDATFNTYISNTALNGGGLAVMLGWDDVHVEDSTFIHNSATDNGGNIYVNLVGHTVSFRRIVVKSGSATIGGGLYAIDSDLDIANALFSKNTATSEAAGMYIKNTTGTLANSVFWANSGPGGSGLRVSTGVVFDVVNTAFTGNTGSAALWLSSGTAPIVRYGDLFGNTAAVANMLDPTGVDGNIAVQPMFAKPAKGKFRLLAGSPLIDAGDPAILDADGTVSDIGRFGGPDAN